MITADQIKSVVISDTDGDYKEAQRLKGMLRQLREQRNPLYLKEAEFDEILKWKLGTQYGRRQDQRKLNTDDVIRAVTTAALNITHVDRDYELELRVNLLWSLRGVGVPVASAVLAVAFPETYAIIDYRVWRQVFGEDGSGFNTNDYKRYMREIWRLADELGWLPQEVDFAIWKYDLQHYK
jgi:hypothetical protein